MEKPHMDTGHEERALLVNTVSILRHMAKRLRSGENVEGVATDIEGLADVLASK